MKRNQISPLIPRVGFVLFLLLVTAVSATAQTDDPSTIPPPDSITIAGTIQTELGCSGNWNTTCAESQLQYDEANDLWIAAFELPAGDYEYKAALNGSWDDNYGLDGEYYGENIPLSIAEDGSVTFWYDHKTRWVSDSINSPLSTDGLPDSALAPAAVSSSGNEGGLPAPAAPIPDLVVVPSTIQSVAGCAGDWQPDCKATALTFDEEDQLWVGTFDLPAGEYEYKAALNGTWDVNFGLNAEPGGANIPLVVEEDTAVSFYFDHNTGWIADDINNTIANVPGDFQDEIGCPGDWAPDCLATWLQDPDGDGNFTFQTIDIPAGSYEAKVAVAQSWTENYGEAGALDGANIPFAVPEEDTLVTFTWNEGSKLMTIAVGAGDGPQGNLAEQRAHWVSENIIAWPIDHEEGNSYAFHYDPRGNPFALGADGVDSPESVSLTVLDALPDDMIAKFPHLRNATALQFDTDDLGFIKIALKGQTAVSAQNSEGQAIDATGLQIPGVLDDLYTYDGTLGVSWDGNTPTINLWAPTARLVKLHVFDDSNPETNSQSTAMRVDPNTGVWSLTGEPDWANKYYLYEVQVYLPSEGGVQSNLVTDPYSFSLAQNSLRSQLVNLDNAELKPEGWDEVAKPELNAPEDIVLYELHIRDFSVNDDTVPEDLKGTFAAFTLANSNGMTHLRRLAEAGLTHIHLLPVFDIATIDENKSTWESATFTDLAGFSTDSEEQQAFVEASAEKDGFNWGYDPFHYTVPEGSYATNPDGSQRILEFRQMVQSLNQNELRLVMDVVYNHTNAAGQDDKSVLDRIVPGYYHRLNAAGKVERSTCCANTATEHNMMRKLMVDSILTWATDYKVDGFRFDLMGHHMKDDMLAVRDALDSLTVAENGVDGQAIYLYGEGWNFGEVADNARGINAIQQNMGGTGIGTFNDRIRDAIRGGNPFGDYQKQGFINGLYTDPNETDQGSEEQQLAKLLELTDQLRVGLAGNLKAYEFVAADGETTTGKQVLYNGQFAGYTEDPQENINYASAHDNETLFDAIQYKAPPTATVAERAQMQQMGLSLVMLGQGIPFFHAGSDLLRSKDFDRDSYNSGDWFNRLDFTYADNNWGIGLPVASKNQENWELQRPYLANPDIAPDSEAIQQTATYFQQLLQIRQSSPLFRLQTAVEVQARLQFHNTGPDQIPGMIVMSISDLVGEDLDANAAMVAVLFNATPETQSFTEEAWVGAELFLHPVLATSSQSRFTEMRFDAASGTFSLPARSTAVFVMPQQGEEVVAEEEMVEEETAVSEATEAHDETIMEEDAHAESAQPTGPNNGMQYALIAVLIGFVFAGLVALFTSRQKQP